MVVAETVFSGDEGYRLWLRYDPLPAKAIESARPHITSLVIPGDSATMDAIRTELGNGCTGLLGQDVRLANGVGRNGAVIVGTPKSSSQIAGLGWGRQLAPLGPEGFLIRATI